MFIPKVNIKYYKQLHVFSHNKYFLKDGDGLPAVHKFLESLGLAFIIRMKHVLGGWRDVQWLRLGTFLAEDQDSLPSIPIRWLTTACLILSSVITGACTHVHLDIHIHTIKIKINHRKYLKRN